MEIPKLQISKKKYVGESTVISMRLPKDMLIELDEAASAAGRTRNEILIMALEFALKYMEVESKEQ